jgi:hypothetical protein
LISWLIVPSSYVQAIKGFLKARLGFNPILNGFGKSGSVKKDKSWNTEKRPRPIERTKNYKVRFFCI